MRVLVLRDARSAAETAGDLAARGHEPLRLPLSAIADTHEPPPPGPFAAIVVTSRNAVAALSRRPELLHAAVLAVGPSTASHIRAAGFSDVREGGATAGSLLRPAAGLARRAALPLLLALGRRRTSDLEDGLTREAVPFRLWETYDTKALHPSGADLATLLADGPPDAVLLLSEGQARGFADLVARTGALLEPIPRLLCLSARIAAALPPKLRSLTTIGAEPSLQALFDQLDSTNSA